MPAPPKADDKKEPTPEPDTSKPPAWWNKEPEWFRKGPKSPDPVDEVKEREKKAAAPAAATPAGAAAVPPKAGRHILHFGRMIGVSKDFKPGGALFKAKPEKKPKA